MTWKAWLPIVIDVIWILAELGIIGAAIWRFWTGDVEMATFLLVVYLAFRKDK